MFMLVERRCGLWVITEVRIGNGFQEEWGRAAMSL